MNIIGKVDAVECLLKEGMQAALQCERLEREVHRRRRGWHDIADRQLIQDQKDGGGPRRRLPFNYLNKCTADLIEELRRVVPIIPKDVEDAE